MDYASTHSCVASHKLRQLEYANISSFPDGFIASHSRLAPVKSLILRDLSLIPFEDIRLSGKLPALNKLILDSCYWSPQDEHFDTVKPQKLNILTIRPNMRDRHVSDVLEWGLASCSALELASLSCSVDTDMSIVYRMLGACLLTLQNVAFDTIGPLSGSGRGSTRMSR